MARGPIRPHDRPDVSGVRDLNLGPETKKLTDRFHAAEHQDGRTISYAFATEMAKMLERWLDVAWCWPDACPARICNGPHFRVRYQHDKLGADHNTVEIIEPANHVGETFPDVPYTIVR